MAHADAVGYSFVQTAQDVAQLQDLMREHSDVRKQAKPHAAPLTIVAKIETKKAIENLPEIIVQAAGQHPFAVMIARGDMAVEVGYERMAEMQEEILWLCEAAQVPVIWATQVLEQFVKEGIPSRAEMTDAAMSGRAECVMLNKGPYVTEAVTILDDVLTRMQAHQSKKTPQLRALHSW
jgi:pyruvate kinase